jgi:peptidoglycan/xylan/chitin deacetylase (PgdA/CDA1 family)
MKKLPRFFSQQISRLFPVSSLFKLTTPLFLPFYHVVSNQNLPHIYNYQYRNTTRFEEELDFYLKHFTPVPLEYLVEHPHSKKKVFHLSFDDGLKECAEIVAPLLLKKGIPATFFVNTDFVGNKALFHKYKASLIWGELQKIPPAKARKIAKDAGFANKNILDVSILQTPVLDKMGQLLSIDFESFLKTTSPYLTKEQLLTLKEDGFSIGAHSCNHPEFWKISPAEQLEQVQKSMEWINSTIQPKIKTFAFPFTDDGVSASVLETIKSNNICDITFGTAGLKYDTFDFHRQRYPVEIPGDFVQNIKTEWVYFFLRKQIGKASVKH